ncbi:hypothetical protein CWR43_18810 [Rhizobium sullae]|uniref:Uncharacterized protein n=1 Tax=Rhizobium sullae TaxID=50338 RepID=A0A2N0D7W5_RHISU|nr:hypothetical protein CWR43_18810 [Rhizobium sullae]
MEMVFRDSSGARWASLSKIGKFDAASGFDVAPVVRVAVGTAATDGKLTRATFFGAAPRTSELAAPLIS